MHFDSKAAQLGTCSDLRTGAVSTPIYQTATFCHPELGQSTGYDYIRSHNPTRQILEEAIAELEEGNAGFAFSSGMAAITAVLMLYREVDHVVVSEDCYGGMISFRVTSSEVAAYILKRVRLLRLSESLGGVESLITLPAAQTHADVPPEVRKLQGVTHSLLRLSVEIEEPRDLIADLMQAASGAEGRGAI